MAEPTQRQRRSAIQLLALLTLCSPAAAQTGGCILVPDDQNPSEKILRCGDDLVVRTVPGTRYHLENAEKGSPDTARLDAGALMIEFHGSGKRQNFQILTPEAIASVRGTKWIVEVTAGQTSTFVMSGTVSVTGRNGGRSADLGPGEGSDVDSGSGTVVVKRWPGSRVKALLARFGQ